NVAFSRAQCRLIVMLQRGWEQNPPLLQLSKLSKPVRPEPDAVPRFLPAKLDRNRPPKTETKPTPPSSRTSQTIQKSLVNEFREELIRRGAQGKPKREVQRLSVEVKDKAKFRSVSYQDIDALVEEFCGRG